MPKSTKKPARKGGAKPAAPKKAAKKLTARQQDQKIADDLRAQREREAGRNAARSMLEAPVVLSARTAQSIVDSMRAPTRLTVEEHQAEIDAYQDELRKEFAKLNKPAKKTYRFRDAITGLFVRMRDAVKRPFTTVRERVGFDP